MTVEYSKPPWEKLERTDSHYCRVVMGSIARRPHPSGVAGSASGKPPLSPRPGPRKPQKAPNSSTGQNSRWGSADSVRSKALSNRGQFPGSDLHSKPFYGAGAGKLPTRHNEETPFYYGCDTARPRPCSQASDSRRNSTNSRSSALQRSLTASNNYTANVSRNRSASSRQIAPLNRLAAVNSPPPRSVSLQGLPPPPLRVPRKSNATPRGAQRRRGGSQRVWSAINTVPRPLPKTSQLAQHCFFVSAPPPSREAAREKFDAAAPVKPIPLSEANQPAQRRFPASASPLPRRESQEAAGQTLFQVFGLVPGGDQEKRESADTQATGNTDATFVEVDGEKSSPPKFERSPTPSSDSPDKPVAPIVVTRGEPRSPGGLRSSCTSPINSPTKSVTINLIPTSERSHSGSEDSHSGSSPYKTTGKDVSVAIKSELSNKFRSEPT